MNFAPHRRSVNKVEIKSWCWVLIAGALLLAVHPTKATPPSWWLERGVINPDDTNATPNDFAAVNQGQVKFIAEQAMQEMDAHLPGGAGSAVHAKVDAWTTPTSTTNDYAPVNLGALKTLAKPFYDRLKAVGYVADYPWVGHEAQTNNYAAANIGQVKNLFSFDLMVATTANDLDHDGIADWWEKTYFPGYPGNAINPAATAARGDMTIVQAFQQGLNPNDFYNGHLPTISKASGDQQTGSAGRYVPAPLVVLVCDQNGVGISNAPVVFQVGSAGGKLIVSSSKPLVDSLTIRTDANGQASVVYQLPNAASVVTQIQATVTSGTQNTQLTFVENSDDGSGTYISPFAPTNFVAQGNPDLSIDMSWENHTDDQTPVIIEIMNAQHQWEVVATLPPGTTSYHAPGLQ